MLKVEVIGNLGADAEVKDYQGNKFVTFRVAHSSKFKNADGQQTESTTWVDVTMNDTESKVIPFLKAGVKVFVRGNASLRVYSSPKDRMMKATRFFTIAAALCRCLHGRSNCVVVFLRTFHDSLLTRQVEPCLTSPSTIGAISQSRG